VADLQIIRKNRWQVVIMVVALPLLALFAVYSLIFLAGQDALLQTTNAGEFVDPPLMARDLALRDAERRPVDGSDSWWIWVASDDCSAACRQALDELSGLHARLAEDAGRVRLALVTADSSGAAGLPAVERFRSSGERRLDAGVYIVDPAGNLVLRHSLGASVDAVVEDLQKMLKVSRLG